jgi:hypothetical protein
MRNIFAMWLSLIFLMVPNIGWSGDLNAPDGPAGAASAMYTLEDLYNRLNAGTAGTKRSGSFAEPSSGPTAGTGHTIDDIMGKAPASDPTNGAVAANVLAGKTFWGLTTGGGWGLTTGQMTNNGAGTTITPGTTNRTIPAGYWSSVNTVSGDADLTAGNIKSGVDIFGVTGTSAIPSGTATEADVLASKTFSNDTSTGLTGTMTNNGAGRTITPGTTDQTILAGYWSTDNTVAGSANLTSGNIKSGVSIFGVAGNTNVVDTTAAAPISASEMKTGRVGFVNGATITGSGTQTLSAASDTVTAGYYEQTTLSDVDSDLKSTNIKSDVTIFGVAGAVYAPVPRTGQTSTVPVDPAPGGSDGNLRKGVVWPSTRFTNNNNGTVTDNLTGLIWLKNANCFGTQLWSAALAVCNTLATEACGLTDGSMAGQWRLPNRFELESLLDLAYVNPALSNDVGTAQWSSEGTISSFTDVQWFNAYWSSTTLASDNDYAWFVYISDGANGRWQKNETPRYVWPVRGGQ